MNRVFVKGWGAVSPAGWGTAALIQAIDGGIPLPPSELARPGWQKALRVRCVPKPQARPTFLSHPRLRRSSPLVFPETVFNAPASHLSAFLGSSAENYTVVGDATAFVHGLEIAAHWLTEERVDGCLVVAAEELDWLTADAFRHFSRSVVCAEGAGALYLTSARTESTVVELDSVADGVPFTEHVSAEEAIRRAAAVLASSHDDELLVDGLRGGTRLDQPEAAAWQDWPGPRLSPKRLFGEALTASAAWQCVVGCDAVASGRHPSSRVSVVGPNAQAIAARFKSSRTVS